MFKKLSAFLLAFLLLLTLVACGGTQPPTISEAPAPAELRVLAYETYSNIFHYLSIGPGQPGAYDIDLVMDMDMTMFGETVHTRTYASMVMIADGHRTQASIAMTMDMGELDGMSLGTTDMEMYMVLEGETLTAMRFKVDGQEIPAEFFPDGELEAIFEAAFEDTVNLPELYLEAVLSAEFEELDGNTVIHMALDGEALLDLTMSRMENALGGAWVPADMDVEAADIYMTIVTDGHGNPLSLVMEWPMRISLDGEEAVMTSISTLTFNAFGDNVEMSLFV